MPLDNPRAYSNPRSKHYVKNRKRRVAIKENIMAKGGKRQRFPQEARQTRSEGVGAGARGRGGVGGNSQPGLGRQLSSRVSSGAITQEQAERTLKERQTFKAAYGQNWRKHVYGQDVKGLRTGLAGGKSDDPQYQAAYKAAMGGRKEALEKARKKVGRTSKIKRNIQARQYRPKPMGIQPGSRGSGKRKYL